MDRLEPNQEHKSDFKDVLSDEAKLIRERRGREDAKHLPDGSVRSSEVENLVGLALSGGGIRAASVGLGCLQALYGRDGKGRFYELDYLSTVSGGGYIGGYLSSAVVASKVKEALASKIADGTDTDYGQPPLVQRFIFGGKYLFRPWEATNKYLIGLFLTNLFLVSGLVAFAALVAFAWRSLDYDGAREFLDLFDLDSGVFTAFLPFLFFLACWFFAWLASIWRQQAEAPGNWAQRLLYFMLASLFIGAVILVVNPEIKVGFLRVFFGDGMVSNGGQLAKWLLGLLAGALTPFLAPKALLRIGLNPRRIWERVLFRVAMFALLVGVPLLVIGVLATPNISDTARDPDDNLRAGDIVSWPAFLALMDSLPQDNAAQDAANYRNDRPTPKPPAFHEVTRSEQNEMRVRLREAAIKLNADMVELAQLREQLDKECGKFRRALYLVGWFSKEENPLRDYWSWNRVVVEEQKEFCGNFSRTVLESRYFPAALLSGYLLEDEPKWPPLNLSQASAPAQAAAAQKDKDADKGPLKADGNVFQQIVGKLRDNEAKKLKDVDLSEDLDDAARSYLAWPTSYVKELNLSLLRAMHPECFFDEGKVYRQLVIDGDQSRRGVVFLVALGIFVVFVNLVNANSTSLHRFYRNRLRKAYFVPKDTNKRAASDQGKSTENNDFELTQLNTTAEGAPYHLINATIDLARPRFLDAVDDECRALDADRRDVQTFIFSKLYCGSDATGWARTGDYQRFRNDNINVFDAIALSGSPIDPFRANSLGLTTAMSALNLTLGQWMPNPRFKKPWHMPSFSVLLKDWFFSRSVDESTYCYVSDGGFTDNLGIMSLLRRRCRLIIALDASCDADRAFSDLNWVIRAARIRYGVKILEPTDGQGAEEVLNTACLEPDAQGICKRHFALAQIKYPEPGAPPAWLVYLKPSFTGDEGADLLKYRIEAPDFPNDDTANQFYEPARVEAYRQMGFHITADFCRLLEGSEHMLTAMPALEESLVTERSNEKRDDKQRRQLPRAAHDAVHAVETITDTLKQLVVRDSLRDGRRQTASRDTAVALQSIVDTLRTQMNEKVGHSDDVQLADLRAGQLGEAAVAQPDGTYPTGTACPKSGLWESSCDRGHREPKTFVELDLFDPCPTCGETANWTRISD